MRCAARCLPTTTANKAQKAEAVSFAKDNLLFIHLERTTCFLFLHWIGIFCPSRSQLSMFFEDREWAVATNLIATANLKYWLISISSSVDCWFRCGNRLIILLKRLAFGLSAVNLLNESQQLFVEKYCCNYNGQGRVLPLLSTNTM